MVLSLGEKLSTKEGRSWSKGRKDAHKRWINIREILKEREYVLEWWGGWSRGVWGLWQTLSRARANISEATCVQNGLQILDDSRITKRFKRRRDKKMESKHQSKWWYNTWDYSCYIWSSTQNYTWGQILSKRYTDNITIIITKVRSWWTCRDCNRWG